MTAGPVPDPVAIRAYLDALWPAPEAAPAGAHLVVFSPGAFLEWFPLTAGLGPVEAAIASQAGAHDVYVGVLAQGPEGMVNEKGQPGRGTMATARLLPAAFLDLDVGAEGHAATAHPATTEEALLALAEAVPLAPSFVVSTGGGVHPYWLLKAPLDLSEPGAREVAGETLLRLEGTVREHWQGRGWRLELGRRPRPGAAPGRDGQPQEDAAGAGAGDHDRPDGGRLRPRRPGRRLPGPGLPHHRRSRPRGDGPARRRRGVRARRPGGDRGRVRLHGPGEGPPGAGDRALLAAPALHHRALRRGRGAGPRPQPGPPRLPPRRDGAEAGPGPGARPGDVRLHRGAPGLRRLRVVRLPGQDQESHPARSDGGPEPPRPRPGAPAGHRL